LTVVDNAELSGYEAELEGRRVGFIAYRRRNDTLVMFHAEVDPEVEGRGIASAMATAAFDDVRARGLTIVASCPFIESFLERHPEYDSIVADG